MVCYFKPEDIEKLHTGREDMHRQFAELRDRFLGRKYQTEHGHEFAYHGSRGALVGLIGPKLRNRPSRRTDGEVGADTRVRNLKNQAYGNTSDWVMLFTAHVDAGGKTEIDVLARLAKYKVVRMYYKDGK